MKPILVLLVLGLGACVADTTDFTKQQIRDMPEPDRDYCALYDWYGDGECDDFCLEADSDCGGCLITGCSGQICADEDVITTCEWTDAYACYGEHSTCERQADGACGWTETPELVACLDDPTPEPECVATGCSGQLCADGPRDSTCEWLEEYACYQEIGVCERQADGACGWTETDELLACLADPTPPAPDCIRTGCSGQLCADEAIASTCEFLPEYACYQEIGVCERQTDGACGWTDTPELAACVADAMTPEPEPEPTCMITGCSGQVCAAEPVVTTCEARPEYVCYTRHGACEGQRDGACGWTPSAELEACLAEFR